MITYLSPTSLRLFYRDPEEFYRIYIADTKIPRVPQTQPMSVGSAFDAYFKSYVTKTLYGEVREQFAFTTIFEKQVESHNRDFALEAGRKCWEAYKTSGALSDLMIELEQSLVEPKFEFEVRQDVKHQGQMQGIPLLGKPDVWFVTKHGVHVVFDLKVNGYCSASPTSPKPGYIIVRDGWSPPTSRNHNQPHKDCIPMAVDGLVINCGTTLEIVNEEWAEQLAIYGWVLGEEIGSNFVVAIDQLCGNPVRVASHRCRISGAFQLALIKRCMDAWIAISGMGFLPKDKMEQLEREQRLFLSNDSKDRFLAECIGREHRNF